MVKLHLSNEKSWYNHFRSYILPIYVDKYIPYDEVREAILKPYKATFVHDKDGGWFIFEDDELATLFLLRFS